MAAHTPRPPSLLSQPAYLAGQVSKHGRRALEGALRERDLALIQHAILVALTDFGSLSQQQLADSLDFDKSHLVAHIDRLEERGFLKRTRDPSDRRRNQLTLTPDGRALVDELQRVGRRSDQGFLDALSAAEQRTLISLLRRVVEANDAVRQGAGSAGSGRRRSKSRRSTG
jgi:MarR family transcriptional regulator, lower aerobic nicotinate degradation pathway regulator